MQFCEDIVLNILASNVVASRSERKCGSPTHLHIVCRVDAFMNAGKELRSDGDACLFGMVTYLLVERQMVSWCAVPPDKDDEVCLGIVMGDETYQQEAELWNLFVAPPFVERAVVH